MTLLIARKLTRRVATGRRVLSQAWMAQRTRHYPTKTAHIAMGMMLRAVGRQGRVVAWVMPGGAGAKQGQVARRRRTRICARLEGRGLADGRRFLVCWFFESRTGKEIVTDGGVRQLVDTAGGEEGQ